MSHTVAGKSKLLGRVRRIKGQVEAIERALEGEHGCSEILQLVASVRGAIGGLTAELIDDHMQDHVIGAANAAERERGASALMDVIKTYVK
ncbi:MAG: metal/formaldehyde-sensitive transcriptional repressor [Hyphomicrobium sp.]|jgi:DNA-binding FrmR family transcriptional regulator|uniref:metal/formaldehyde-sensitive transcriptional repressor n=1 Tax=Hyphomicrobium sp. DMF-1 TaxID=3019544 RepID=UPI000BD80391|nr:metal/formaldehyde-sensitive transcriptional repressor [Hyphomicrobium sp. DMF-1]MBN8912298.1 metal/formaldehyde-sensitive transcriptional repressor [Hyphomicrobiales bacterium]OYW53704.1 MAG: transcriptional regulator [Hyphomicrobium sp. 12-62-95]OYX98436.1 MAG: transcriptional regulator [Hyphomicrobium sp. 32-62-53]WBT37966.1 metal/formaldehyde-sensitive transcriptional repressor [Hyphomicrobium sp. DMF-1]